MQAPRVVQVRKGSPSPVSARPGRLIAGSPVVVCTGATTGYPTLLRGQFRTAPVVPVQVSKDSLEQQVASFLASNPEVQRRHTLVRKSDSVYRLDGREIGLEWQQFGSLGCQGRLVVVDGPLRQPLADYISSTEANAEYEAIVAETGASSVHLLPKEKQISFNDQHQAYSRLDAMKVAKEQALVRERAAEYVQAGKALPVDIMANYRKTIQKKLAPVPLNRIRGSLSSSDLRR